MDLELRGQLYHFWNVHYSWRMLVVIAETAGTTECVRLCICVCVLVCAREQRREKLDRC